MAGDPYPDYYLEKTEVKPLYHADDEDIKEKFNVTGFEITEKDSIKTMEIKGNMLNAHEYLTDVSGKIPLDEDSKDLQVKINTLIMELFEFIFNAKTSQGTLEDFPVNAEQEQEMAGKDPAGEAVPEERQIDNFDGEPPVTEPEDSDLFDKAPTDNIKEDA